MRAGRETPLPSPPGAAGNLPARAPAPDLWHMPLVCSLPDGISEEISGLRRSLSAPLKILQTPLSHSAPF